MRIRITPVPREPIDIKMLASVLIELAIERHREQTTKAKAQNDQSKPEDRDG